MFNTGKKQLHLFVEGRWGWAPRAAAAILASSVAPAAAANRVIQRVTGREASRHKNKSLVGLKSVRAC